MENPVHEKDGQWWFFDETWADEYGPYATEELADEAVKQYAAYLDGKGLFVPPAQACGI
jgi:hypothetical protein